MNGQVNTGIPDSFPPTAFPWFRRIGIRSMWLLGRETTRPSTVYTVSHNTPGSPVNSCLSLPGRSFARPYLTPVNDETGGHFPPPVTEAEVPKEILSPTGANGHKAPPLSLAAGRGPSSLIWARCCLSNEGHRDYLYRNRGELANTGQFGRDITLSCQSELLQGQEVKTAGDTSR